MEDKKMPITEGGPRPSSNDTQPRGHTRRALFASALATAAGLTLATPGAAQTTPPLDLGQSPDADPSAQLKPELTFSEPIQQGGKEGGRTKWETVKAVNAQSVPTVLKPDMLSTLTESLLATQNNGATALRLAGIPRGATPTGAKMMDQGLTIGSDGVQLVFGKSIKDNVVTFFTADLDEADRAKVNDSDATRLQYDMGVANRFVRMVFGDGYEAQGSGWVQSPEMMTFTDLLGKKEPGLQMNFSQAEALVTTPEAAVGLQMNPEALAEEPEVAGVTISPAEPTQ